MRNLITSQEVIELAFAENSNMMAESISDTAIRIAEIKYIRPAFGVMYPLLADKYADYTNDYVKPALAYFVKCEIVSSIAIDMSNSGVAVANPQYQSAATDKQRQRLYDSEMSKAKTLLDFALEYIATHSEEFPDFSGEAPKKHHRVGGILLGGGTSRSQSASIAGEAFKNEIEQLSKDVAGKVDKEQGKGLSSNDYTDADKAEVAKIKDKADEKEVEELRKQLGNISADLLTPATYSELRTLKKEGKLVPGMKYRITDFVTVTTQADTRSAKHQFDIIVTAVDNRTLSEKAQAIQHEGDTYFANSNLKAWVVWYDFDNTKSRFQWAKDWDKETPAQWSCGAGLIEERYDSGASTAYTTAVVDGKTKYLYNPSNLSAYLADKEVYERVVGDSITSTEGFIYEADSAPDNYGDEEYEDWYWDDMGEMRVKTADGKVVAVLSNWGSGDFYDSERDSEGSYIINFSPYAEWIEDEEVYRFTPNYGAEDWFEYVMGGAIESYTKAPYTGSKESLRYAFDSIVPKTTTQVMQVYSSETGKVYYYGEDVDSPSAIDTVTYTDFEGGGKGVIYRLIDEKRNDFPYDFKNIQFKVDGDWMYTFHYQNKEYSFYKSIHSNELKYNNSTNIKLKKPIIWNTNTAYGNTILVCGDTNPCIFSGATYNNVIYLRSTGEITAKKDLYHNLLNISYPFFANNVFANNTIDYTLASMTFNGMCYGCTFLPLTDSTIHNSLVVNCDRMYTSTIKGCGTISTVNRNGNLIGQVFMCDIDLGTRGSNVKLVENRTVSKTQCIDGWRIKAMNWGSDEVEINISDYPLSSGYPLNIAKNSKGEIKVYCDADLVQ